ncbi:MAG: hypothetical protein IMX05_02120 [Hydrogenibacillus schlegelii]|nr:hypothetical protein [Hydrogenibacillus schlegelii]
MIMSLKKTLTLVAVFLVALTLSACAEKEASSRELSNSENPSASAAENESPGTSGREEQNQNWNEVPLDAERVKALQEQVDGGHRPGLLDPRQVAYEFLEGTLGIPGREVVEMKEVGESAEGKGLEASLEDGRKIELFLVQPVRKDPTGIWQVQKYRFK